MVNPPPYTASKEKACIPIPQTVMSHSNLRRLFYRFQIIVFGIHFKFRGVINLRRTSRPHLWTEQMLRWTNRQTKHVKLQNLTGGRDVIRTLYTKKKWMSKNWYQHTPASFVATFKVLCLFSFHVSARFKHQISKQSKTLTKITTNDNKLIQIYQHKTQPSTSSTNCRP